MKTQFNSMKHKPPYSEDDESLSETVLVYDGDGNLWDLGFFSFHENEWHVLGDDSLDLICWTLLPNPNEFLKGKDLPIVQHVGYRH